MCTTLLLSKIRFSVMAINRSIALQKEGQLQRNHHSLSLNIEDTNERKEFLYKLCSNVHQQSKHLCSYSKPIMKAHVGTMSIYLKYRQ